jgi:hypothetical protein
MVRYYNERVSERLSLLAFFHSEIQYKY